MLFAADPFGGVFLLTWTAARCRDPVVTWQTSVFDQTVEEHEIEIMDVKFILVRKTLSDEPSVHQLA